MFLSSINDTSNQYLIIVWIAVCIAALSIEFATVALVSVWFSVGAIVAAVLAAFNVPWEIQTLVFALVSICSFSLCKIFYRPHKNDLKSMPNIIGETVLITSKVSAEQPGQGKIRDVIWSVTTDDVYSTYEKGELAIVKEVRGNKLIIERKEI